MRIKNIIATLLALTLLALSAVSAAQSRPPQPKQIPQFVPDRVLVKFKPGIAASAIGKAHRQVRGYTLRTIPGIGVQVVRVQAGTVKDKVAAYRANPNVQYAEPDYYRLLVVPTEDDGPTPAGGDLFADQWYLNNTGQVHSTSAFTSTQGVNDADIDAPEGWGLSKGKITTDPAARNTPKIAVLDSGVSCVELDLQSKCLEQVNVVKDFVANRFWDDGDGDVLGHGTFVASEAAAETDNGIGIAGTGWNTSFGAFKVCYQELVIIDGNLAFVGLCPVSASADAIMRASTDQLDTGGALLRSKYNVITMSYGSDFIDPVSGEISATDPSNAECDAIETAWENGVVIVAAAGNNGDTSRVYPAACTHSVTGQSTVISVAAADDSDNRASFSTYSDDGDDWVSMAAPGEAIVGILPFNHCGLATPNDSCVDWWNGTSMAAPLVAGAAAVVWAHLFSEQSAQFCTSPSGVACNEVVRSHLEYGADTISAASPLQGLLTWSQHGRLNLQGALSIIDTDIDGLPNTVDTDDDDDGLSDSNEISIYFTDPLNPDSDSDGLTDGDEVNLYTTNPTLRDSDGDGFGDDVEIGIGTNANDPSGPWPPSDGDLAPVGVYDGLVNVADYLVALRMALGLIPQTTLDIAHGDLQPIGTSAGVIDTADVLLILQQSLNSP